MSLEKKCEDSSSKELALASQSPCMEWIDESHGPVAVYLNKHMDELSGVVSGLGVMFGYPGGLLGMLHGAHPDDYVDFSQDQPKGPMRMNSKMALGIVGGAALIASTGYFNPLFLMAVNLIGYVGARTAAAYNRTQRTSDQISDLSD